jgi:alpha-galactosidase
MHYGWEYRQMITDILDTLNNDLPSIVPNYDEEEGYELAGFVWFQGWNDLIDWQKVNEYEFNLANLIRDVRVDLSAPTMPFVIGELGMKGLDPVGPGTGRYKAMQQAEKNVALYDEFRDSTLFVPTARYAVENGTHYNGEYHYNGRADTYCHIGHAFGTAMLELMGVKNEATAITSREARLRMMRGETSAVMGS